MTDAKMKPDPDMMCQAMRKASEALEAIQYFQTAVGFAFGSDATQSSAYSSVRNLADNLSTISAKLNAVAMDADERLTPASRF
jgi:hypothetical protein